MKSKLLYICTLVLLLSFFSCSTQTVYIPKENLNATLMPAEFVEKLEFSELLLPVVSESIERPDDHGIIYYGILRDKENKRIVRSITILVDSKDMDLQPEEYLYYPVYYAINVSKNLSISQTLRSEYDIRRANEKSPVYMPVYATSSVVALAALGIVYIAFTGTALIFGMGKGTYEFTEDVMEGIVVSKEEIVLGFNDYQYDKEGRLVNVSTYLPYRSISKSVIPLYDRTGKKQIGQMYPSSKPILLSEINYKYSNNKATSKIPKAVEIIEYIPKRNKKWMRLPIKD
ncbi:hypothetical protein ND861_15220 [Leptospira sp. 2 VSF19]|uniref:Lipoprotein n=1 Tax=Leptospira soteropolitanensis TaxID=2950025 RepID=A0AAW5VG64_9LEPT|nr:hypothetical protein [Leptospira soteropolitanensis]MCW7493996.1 hypothetical protein [Leptospira soteropolitanensis]MCW7501738.1 hypothetical protein [Leptospira soteropolitanensis]MCW7523842.1 hypothetical protein [Leptospira soteropolitanensis]MCW7527707.1 hypothetical protein [Leptospira soteropolitanensis]MCW7531708.1 hypothetical protein [Leptospira soteropolitanensis]